MGTAWSTARWGHGAWFWDGHSTVLVVLGAWSMVLGWAQHGLSLTFQFISGEAPRRLGTALLRS